MPFFYHIKFVDRSHKIGHTFYSNDFENRVESYLAPAKLKTPMPGY